jgi:hypothetical protein
MRGKLFKQHRGKKTMHGIKIFFLVVVLGLVAVPQTWAGDLFFGAKTGPMILDVSGVSDATNTGVVVGYELLGVLLGDLAVEGELTTTTGDGELNNDKVEVDTKAVYLALRSAGPFYFKAKAGYLNVDVDVGETSSSDSGTSYGVGVGFGIGIAQLELEFTKIDKDIAFVSVGVQF